MQYRIMTQLSHRSAYTYTFDYAARLFAANQRFSAARNDRFVIYSRFSASVPNGPRIRMYTRPRDAFVNARVCISARARALLVILAYRESSLFCNPLNDPGTPVAETGSDDRAESSFHRN